MQLWRAIQLELSATKILYEYIALYQKPHTNMHILHIASGNFFSTYGGGQVYVKNIVDEMIHQQLDVTVISFIESSPRQTDDASWVEKTYNGIRLYEVHLYSKDVLLSLIKDIKPDVIHAHSRKADVCEIGKSLGIPVVVTAHHGGILCPAGALLNSHDEICGLPASYKNCLPCYLRNIRTGIYWYPLLKMMPESVLLKFGRILKKFPFIPLITPIVQVALSIEDKKNEWYTISKYSSLIIAPSVAIADAMTRNGLKENKFCIVPHGIPLPEVIPAYPSIKNGAIKFFYVGRICYVKGLHVLLEAFHRLSDNRIELHIIGGTGNASERRYERRLKKKHRADNRIIWHGKVPPFMVYNTIKDFHILSSVPIFLEVFGLNIAESLAIGKPVLATRCGGAEMQIEDGVNGWLVEPNDVEELVDKIKDIIKKSSELQVMSQKCHTISISQHVNTLAEVYDEVLNKKDNR